LGLDLILLLIFQFNTFYWNWGRK